MIPSLNLLAVLYRVNCSAGVRRPSEHALLQVEGARALLRALQHLPSLRESWGMHNLEPYQALIENSEPDVRWLAVECLALLAKLVSCRIM